MKPPIDFSDVTVTTTSDDGNVSYKFDRTKAAKAFLAKMKLAIEVFDSREDQAELWYYENGYWHPGGAHIISYFLDKIAENYSNSEHINDVLRRIRGELRLRPVKFDITNPYLVGCKGGVTLDLQTGMDRKAAPMDGGGIPYLMEAIPSISKDDAEKYLNAFKMGYPGLLTYWDRCKNKSFRVVVNGKEYHVARSALGRLEYVPRRDEATGKLHKKLKNRLVNVPIQATGVDLFKLASGLLYKEFCKPEYADFNFLLSLHDSVLLECPAERAEECAELVNQVFMLAAQEIFQEAPCRADIKIGSNWSFQEVTA